MKHLPFCLLTVTVFGLLFVTVPASFALDLIENDRYWETSPEAWSDDHAYGDREHRYFADEHRWINAEERRAWREEYTALLADIRTDYAAQLAAIADDDDAFFASLNDSGEAQAPRSRNLVLYPRYSADDLAALGPDDTRMLDELVAVLRGKNAVTLTIGGHTNSVPLSPRAMDRYGDNQKLSEQRAGAVAAYLGHALGLAPDAVSVHGYSDTRPLERNDSARARARNRRVEVSVTYTEPVALVAAPDAVVPPDFLPWWQQPVTTPMLGENNVHEADLNALYQRALEHSTQIEVFRDVPLIRETAILEAEGDFDPRLFIEAEYRDTDEPVGSTLRTGGPNRFREQQSSFTAGVRKKTLIGGEVELSQRLGTQQNNSVFFLPDDQAQSRLRLSYTQPLLRGAGLSYNRSTVAIAKVDHSIAEDELQRQIEAHLLEIAQAYWSLYLERSTYQIGRRLTRNALVVLNDLQGRRGVDALEVQIARARAAHAERQAELVRSAKSIRNAEARLITLLNDPELSFSVDFELVPVLPPLPPRETLGIEQASLQALKNRPEIDQAMKQLRAGMLRTQVSENEMLPELDLIAGLELNGLDGGHRVGNSLENQFDTGEPSYFVGLRMNYAIGNREAKARYQRRRVEVRQLSNQLRTTINTLQLETQVSVREAHAARLELQARYSAMLAAGQELKTLEARRGIALTDGGNGSDFLARLLTAQEDLADTERAFVTSQTSYSLAMVNLDRAMGLLLQTQGIAPTRSQPDAAPPVIELGKR